MWLEAGAYYGIPGNDFRGFKIVGGTLGEPADPANRGTRIAGNASCRPSTCGRPGSTWRDAFRRWPTPRCSMRSSVRSENSPDEHLIVDRHPGCDNVWFAGGGSGHGFKLSPALGEMVASLVEGKAAVNPQFALARLAASPSRPRL